MTAGRSEHRPVRIRRRGRHTTPSQVEKVAEKAGKAAPAVAIAGALVAAPSTQAFAATTHPGAVTAADARGATQHDATATLDSVSTHTVVVSSTSTARHAATQGPAANTHYVVKSGDTLSGIAEHYYRDASDWQWLFHENDKIISDPNLIYPGQSLFVPADPPANFTLNGYVPKHAKPATPAVTTGSSHHDTSSGSHSGTVVVQSASQGSGSGTGSTSLSGTLGCTGLEELWDAAGGNPHDAFMAAEIAMAESGGQQYALSPTDDYGYWQINASNGALATFSAYGNARSAIILSDDGTNWSPWTTY